MPKRKAPKKKRERAKTENTETASVWAHFSRPLARWARQHLANRFDARGSYLPLHRRTPHGKAVTRLGRLTTEIISKHFVGAEVGDLIGLHTTSPDCQCRWVAVDIDHHGDRDNSLKRANRKAAIALFNRARALKFEPLLISSNGRGGYHLIILFDEPAPSAEAFAFAQWFVRDWRELGMSECPETFPKQPQLNRKTRYGHWLRLPGRHHTLRHYSQVWTGRRWASGVDAIRIILATKGQSFDLVPDVAVTYDPKEHESTRKPRPDMQSASGKAEHRRRQIVRQEPVTAVLEHLQNVRECGDGWSARCPAHGDFSNSLSVAQGDDRRVLLYCHAGCPVADIVDALDLSMRDLFDRRLRRRPLRFKKTKTKRT